MLEVAKRVRKLNLQPPCDVACPGERVTEDHKGLKCEVSYPHTLRIEKIYLVNDRTYGYCSQHDVFFTVDTHPQQIIDYGSSYKGA